VTIQQDDTQVAASTNRRRFTAAYKLRILKEAEACKKTGMIGALLRREGLYSSRLSDWKNARERGELEALSPRKRGRKAIVVDPKDQRIAKLESQLKKAEARACEQSQSQPPIIRTRASSKTMTEKPKRALPSIDKSTTASEVTYLAAHLAQLMKLQELVLVTRHTGAAEVQFKQPDGMHM
jgi:transposase